MQILDIVIRTLLAVVFGAIIGREREINNRPAGIRTHALVCLGAAIIAMIQVELASQSMKIILAHPELKSAVTVNGGRIVAQVVSGIGFLGAGTIIINKGSIRGLTTAASLWVVACIGIAIGYGYYEIAMITGISVPIVLIGLKQLEKLLSNKGHHALIRVRFEEGDDHLSILLKYFRERNIHVKEIKLMDREEEYQEQKIGEVRFRLYSRYITNWKKCVADIESFDFVKSVKKKV